ncbi:universal stress protein [Pantanalinema rosaneae CENA516]|uniref:universal stress protein n=1 Tax=Pantanalinema rosaneae TaxID=1620701 RepID=UPI003D6DDBDE
MFQRLLIATDFSDALHRLVHFVPSLAAGGIRHITFLHSVPFWQSGAIPRIDEEKTAQAKAILQPALDSVPAGMEVKVVVDSGKAIDDILRFAKQHQIDLIMVGTPPRNTVSEQLFGSTARELFKRTTVPVMTIRPQLVATYTSEELDLRCRHLFREVLLAYNGSDTAKYMVEQVKHYASRQPDSALASCYLCWVISDAGRRSIPKEPMIKAAKDELATVQAELEPLNLKVHSEVRCGDPVVELFKAAYLADISAIVVSSTDRNAILEYSAPSLCVEILHQSWYPTIYFPPKR